MSLIMLKHWIGKTGNEFSNWLLLLFNITNDA